MVLLVFLTPLFLQAQTQYIYFPVGDFSGGINIRDAPTKLSPKEGLVFNNVMWKRGNSLACREGFRKLNATVIDTFGINSIYKWVKSDEIKKWIAGCGEYLYIMPGDSTEFEGYELSYDVGTVNVDSLSKTVYGIGTKWKRVFGEGSGLTIKIVDSSYTIARIISNEILSLEAQFVEDSVEDHSHIIYHKFSTDQKFFNTWLGKLIITDSYSPVLAYDTSGVVPLAVRYYGDADSIYYDNDTLIIKDTSQVWKTGLLDEGGGVLVEDDLIGDRVILAEFACTTSALVEDSIVLLPISDQTEQWSKIPVDSTCSYCLVDELKGSEDDANYVWITGTTNKKEKWRLDTLDTPLEAGSRFYRGDSLRVWVRNKVRAEGVDEPDSGHLSFDFCKYATHAGYSEQILVNDSIDFGVKTYTFTPENTSGAIWTKKVINSFHFQLRNYDASDTHWVSQVYPVLYFKKRTTTHTHYPVLLTVVRNDADKIYLTPSKLAYIDNHPQEYLVLGNELLKRAFVDSGVTENIDSSGGFLNIYDTDKEWDSTTFQSGYYEIHFPNIDAYYYPIIGNGFCVTGTDTGIVALSIPHNFTSVENYRIYKIEYLKPETQEIFDARLWLAGDSLDPNYLVCSENIPNAESERDFNTPLWRYVDRQDGDKIKRIVTHFENLFIFKENKIKRQAKWIDYEVTDVTNLYGTPSAHSVVSHPAGVFFLDKDGYYILSVENIQRVSDKLHSFFQDSINSDYYSSICVDYYDDHLFYSFPTGSLNDTSFVFSPSLLSWGTLSGMVASSYFVNYDPSDTNEFLFGDTDSGWVYVYGQDYYDLGEHIDLSYKSGWFDMDNSLWKRVKDFKINYAKADSTLIIYSLYQNYSDTAIFVDTIGIDSDADYLQKRFRFLADALSIAFQIEINVEKADHEFVLPFYELNFKIIGDQGYEED